jgi:hypothetical protein
MTRNAEIGRFTKPSTVDELAKSHQRMAKKNVRVQGVANPEE